MTLRRLIAENDEEFTFMVKSTHNIHSDERLEQIRMALIQFGVREVKRDYYRPPEKANKDFPGAPGAPSYCVKVTSALEIPQNAGEQKVSQWCKIPQVHILVHEQGVDPEQEEGDPLEKNDSYKPMADTDPAYDATVDQLDPNAQSDVGDKRIGAFMRELEADRKAREKEHKAFEAFVTSHLGLMERFSREFRKGFYLIERNQRDTTRADVHGPYLVCPDNFEFVASPFPEAKDPKIIKESENKWSITAPGMDPQFKHIGERRIKVYEDTPVSVEVTDMDSGRTRTVMVRGSSDADARDEAIQQVARSDKVDPGRLTAKEPNRPR